MLVLTRRIGEEILIDKGLIQIKVIYIRRGTVAIGIKAPMRIDVDRKEIYLRKHLDEIKAPEQSKPVAMDTTDTVEATL